MNVWYRRTARPYAFPVTTPDDVEVSFVEQDTGPYDSDWNTARIDDEYPEAEIIEDKNCHPRMIADAMLCEVAIYRAAGHALPLAGTFGEYSVEDLDASEADDYEAMCDAVELLYGSEVGQRQRIALIQKLSGDYITSHNLD